DANKIRPYIEGEERSRQHFVAGHEFVKILELDGGSRLQLGVLLQPVKFLRTLHRRHRALAELLQAAIKTIFLRGAAHLFIERRATSRNMQQRVFFSAVDS